MKQLFIVTFYIGLTFFASQSIAQENAQTVTGKLIWSQLSEVGLTQSGHVGNIYVQAGDTIQKGQLLLELDNRPFQARIQTAQARLTRLKLIDEEAEREFERQQALYEAMSIAQRTLTLAEIDRKTAAASLAEAQAELDLAKLDLEYSQLHSPLNGIVLSVESWPGQAINNSQRIQTLFRLASNQPWHISALVEDEILDRLNLGQVYSGKNQNLQARLIRIDPVSKADDRIHRTEVRFELISNPERLKQGQRITLSLP